MSTHPTTESPSRKKGNWLTYVLIAAAGLGMVFIGVPMINSSGSQSIASVNGQDINLNTFNRAVSVTQQQLPSLDRQQVQQQALASIINQTVLRQYPLGQDFQVTDQAVYDEVKRQFGDNELYEKSLEDMRTTPRAYESSLRQDLAVKQYYDALAAAIPNTNQDFQLFLQQVAQQRDVTLITLPLAPASATVAASDADLQSYYQQHIDRYQSPETVAIEYLIIDAGKLYPADKISAEDLAAEKQRLSNLSTRSGQYLIFDDEAEAKKSAQALADGSLSFDQLYSDIHDGKISGEAGDLDSHQQGEGLSETVDKQLFALSKENDISPLFTTDYGPTLIRLGKISENPLLAAGDSAIRESLARKKGQEQYDILANQAFDRASNGDNLQSIAQLTASPIETLENITPQSTSQPWLSDASVQAALFGGQAETVDTIAPPVELDNQRSLFYQVTQRVVPQALPYDSVASRVRTDYQAAQAETRLTASADAILQAINEKKSYQDILQQAGGSEQTHTGINIASNPTPDLPIETLRSIITQNQHAQQSSDAQGNIQISVLERTYPMDSTAIPESIQAALLEQWQYIQQQETNIGQARWLRDQAKITVNQELLAQQSESE